MSQLRHQPGDSWATIERLSGGRWYVVCRYADESSPWISSEVGFQYGPERYARTQRRAERIASRMLARFRKDQSKQVARYEVSE